MKIAVCIALFLAFPLRADPLDAASVSATEARLDPRTETGRLLVGGGVALLAAAAGLGLYAAVDANNPQRADTVRITRVLATGLATTGAGAIVIGGFVLAVAPNGAMMKVRF